MIDTITARYFPTQTEKAEITKRLDADSTGLLIRPITGTRFVTKYYGNFSIRYYFRDGEIFKITVHGSVPKMIYATNYRPTDSLTIKESFLLLKRKSKLPIQRFDVHRMDLGFNVELEYPVESYLSVIDYLSGHKKIDFTNHSVIYQNKSNRLAFYDKVRETKNRIRKLQMEISTTNSNEGLIILNNELIRIQKDFEKIKGKNLLRVEYRTFKDLKKMFNKKLKMEDLYRDDLYKLFPRKVYKVFKKLKYKNDLYYQKIEKPTDFRDYLVMKGLESIGWRNRTEVVLQLTRKVNELSNSHKSAINKYIESSYVS